MPALLEVQGALRQYLVDHRDTDVSSFIEGGSLSAQARLNIYHNTFAATLTTALRLNFPAVHALVGAGYFEYIAGRFIRQAPPASAYLNDYGHTFPAFLESEETAKGVPYLADVARLEWAVSRSLLAADADNLDLQKLAAVPQENQEQVVFHLKPSIVVAESSYPVDAIWQAVLSKDDDAMATIDLSAGGVKLLIERPYEDVEMTRCEMDEWRFANALLNKRSIGELSNDLSSEKASSLLSDYLVRGRITAFSLMQQ